MKKQILSFTLFSLMIGMLHAQQVTKTSYSVDENSIVKDSTGRRITKIEFYDAVVSGNYQFKPVKDRNGNITEYTLVRSEKKDNNTKITFQSTSKHAPTTSLTEGQLAPEFKGKDLNDSIVYDLNDYKGKKIVVLSFWFASCPPCIREIPKLNLLQQRYKDRTDIVFIAPTFEFAESIDSFLIDHPFEYIILPEAYEAIKSYKAMAYPLNVIIGLDGRIAYVSAGGLDGIEYLLDRKIRDLVGISEKQLRIDSTAKHN